LEVLAEQLWRHARFPAATYRIQLHAEFPFSAATEILPYLHELGISDCYTSPILRSRRGSRHGYDVCDHGQINPELGGAEGFEAFSAALKQSGMGLILDVVPNHMGVGDLANGWWNDVLENGPASCFAQYFDIDWHPQNPSLDSKVLLPVLGGFYGPVLERGEIRLAYDQGRFWLHYFELHLPVAPHSAGGILELCADELSRLRGPDDEGVQELRSIATASKLVVPRSDLNPDEMAERYREIASMRRRLSRLVESSAEVRSALERTVGMYNGTPGDLRSFDRLDALLNVQPYRLAFWRVAAEEINYRRFFDINELAAIRMELPEVFHAAHAFVFRLLVDDKATGLRIDHPDGLRDPTGYFRQLQKTYFLDRLVSRLNVPLGDEALERRFERLWQAAVAQEQASPRWPLYVVVEKILSEEEPLPREWAVAGTTGYDFLVAVNDLFIDGSREAAWDRIYKEVTGSRQEFRDIVSMAKRRILQLSMASELNSLAHRLDRITERSRRYRDFTFNTLRLAIREVIAALPVYRTYVTGPEHVPDRDKRFIEAAVAEARWLNPGIADEVFQFVRELLLLRILHEFAESDRESVLDWVLRFQQMTGPIMAKGVEDTAFYIYNRFVSANEVGAHPERFGLSVEAFHAQVTERQRHWPQSMLSTSTHDTKRSEDVRARLNALSEMPEQWEEAIKRWRDWNAPLVGKVDRHPAPSANDQYLLYQTLVGTLSAEPMSPEANVAYCQRMVDYLVKAAKEAKTYTSWTNPNREYEKALQEFAEKILPEGEGTPFTRDLRAFVQRVAHFGYLNSLSQSVLKLTCPGVPDIYQGCELWNFSLVDPDNRRPVDFGLRRKWLSEMRKQIESSCGKLAGLAEDLLANRADGRVKLFVLHRLLRLRRRDSRLFQSGEYRPLAVTQFNAESVLAYERWLEEESLLAAVPCRVVRILQGRTEMPVGEVWGEGRLLLPESAAGGVYRNLFTGETLSVSVADGRSYVALADVFRRFPVAVWLRVKE
jgi:(1->4)-alpha-D-glucan 1-alpha-D-glucosylmutase